MARFIIYGAGAIGGLIGAGLFESGSDVVLIARGTHLKAIESDGLRVLSPDPTRTVRIPVVSHPAEIEFGEDDVVIMSMKTQDTMSALLELRDRAHVGLPIVCAQNGVENERIASRFFENVYGLLVLCPVTYLSPGEIAAHSFSPSGIFDIGHFPSGVDAMAVHISGALRGAGFSSSPRADIMRWKYGKLLDNVPNAVEVVFGLSAVSGQISTRAQTEASECFARARIESVSIGEIDDHRKAHLRRGEIEGYERTGSSTWQSITRSASVESDYLSGEIALIGRLNGFPTPVNALLQSLVTEMASRKKEPGSVNETEFLAMLGE